MWQFFNTVIAMIALGLATYSFYCVSELKRDMIQMQRFMWGHSRWEKERKA